MMIWCKKIMGGKDYEVYEKKLICSVFGHKCNSFDKFICNAGADVEYIEFPGCNHGSWNPAFNYPGFMDWLFKQKKKR